MVETRHDLKRDKRLVEALARVAPGTPLRDGIDNIIRAKTGALIILGDQREISFLFSGGIRLDMEFSPNMLYELAKMDGATILNRGVTRIHRANVQLMPDAAIESQETGTRHRTAERVARQTSALAISISQDRDVVSLYVGDIKYALTDIRVLLGKANQALQTLDQYRTRLDKVTDNLTALEFEDSVTLHDVIGVLQRSEVVARVAGEIDGYLLELGVEGRLVAMQLEELMSGVMKDRQALIRDYLPRRKQSVDRAAERITAATTDELFDPVELAALLGYDRKAKAADTRMTPRGYRVLNSIPRLPSAVIGNIVEKFGTLKALMVADEDDLVAVEGVGRVRATEIGEGLALLKEHAFAEKYSFR
ncbi:MAG: DNA integrity scanning protein DisA [Gaiellales bacterium]|nr:MAG: DNA integrity scanning protein DisA [Gaiellales bacterium]